MLRYETGQSNSTQEYYVSLSSMSAGRAQNSRSGRRIGTMLQEQFSTLAVGLKQGTPAELRSIHFTLCIFLGLSLLTILRLFKVRFLSAGRYFGLNILCCLYVCVYMDDMCL